jgi:hypothetical protein
VTTRIKKMINKIGESENVGSGRTRSLRAISSKYVTTGPDAETPLPTKRILTGD